MQSSIIRLVAIAVSVRVLHFSLLLLSDSLFRDYDSSADLHDHVDYLKGNANPTLLPQLSKMLVWDSVFFSEIAKRGYEYEQFYAFFPLLPGKYPLNDCDLMLATKA